MTTQGGSASCTPPPPFCPSVFIYDRILCLLQLICLVAAPAAAEHTTKTTIDAKVIISSVVTLRCSGSALPRSRLYVAAYKALSFYTCGLGRLPGPHNGCSQGGPGKQGRLRLWGSFWNATVDTQGRPSWKHKLYKVQHLAMVCYECQTLILLSRNAGAQRGWALCGPSACMPATLRNNSLLNGIVPG